jgi:hypothetical protein
LAIQPESSGEPEVRLGFEGYEAHKLDNVMLGSIIDSVVQSAPDEHLRKHWDQITKAYRECGWPGPWAESLSSAIEFASAEALSCFEVSSSYGLSGWVLAKRCVLVGRQSSTAVDSSPNNSCMDSPVKR